MQHRTHGMNSTTRCFPRTMVEAFGPYARLDTLTPPLWARVARAVWRWL